MKTEEPGKTTAAETVADDTSARERDVPPASEAEAGRGRHGQRRVMPGPGAKNWTLEGHIRIDPSGAAGTGPWNLSCAQAAQAYGAVEQVGRGNYLLLMALFIHIDRHDIDHAADCPARKGDEALTVVVRAMEARAAEDA